MNICIIILSWTVDWSVLCTSRSVFRALLLTRYPHPSSQCTIHHLYMTWHENVNVLTALSRALLRILSEQRVWVLELTSEQKIGSGSEVLSLWKSSFYSIILLADQLLSCTRRSDSGKCDSPLCESLEQSLINSCFLLPFAQILAEIPLSIHDSPFPADLQDTVGTFPAPPDPTGKVPCPLSPLPPRKVSAYSVTDVTKRIGD